MAGERIDTRGIMARHGIGRSRLSELHSHRKTTGFPTAQRVDGRYEWDQEEVDAWFAQRRSSGAARWTKIAKRLAALEPDMLVTAPELAQLFVFESTAVVHHLLHDSPGYLPEPDFRIPPPENRPADYRSPLQRPGPGRPPEMAWYVATLREWVQGQQDAAHAAAHHKRSSTRTRPSRLQPVPVEGDPHELLGAPQAAFLLGYTSTDSFSSALAQGRLPLLTAGDARAVGSRGTPHRVWKRRTILRQAAQRATRTKRTQADEAGGGAESPTDTS